MSKTLPSLLDVYCIYVYDSNLGFNLDFFPCNSLRELWMQAQARCNLVLFFSVFSRQLLG